MSYYRRGYNWEQVEYLPAPVGGWNPDANPWELPSTQAAALDNFLIRPGQIMARGAFSQLVDISASAPAPVACVPTGLFCISTLSQVGAMPWDAPVLASSSSQLAQAGTTLTWVNALGAKQTTTAASRHVVPGPRWINFDGALYGLGIDSEATPLRDAGNSYYMPASQLLTQAFYTGITAATQAGSAPTVTGTNWARVSGSDVQYQQSVAAGGTSSSGNLEAWGFSLPSGATVDDLSLQVESVAPGAGSSTAASPGSFASDGSGVAWTSSGGGSYACAVNGGGAAVLDLYNLGLSVPADSVITGVDVNVTTSGHLVGTVITHLQLTNGAFSYIGSVKPDGVNYYGDYGSSSDSWGATLTPAIVNGTGFGVAIGVQPQIAGATGPIYLTLNSLTVYYVIQPNSGINLSAQLTSGGTLIGSSVTVPFDGTHTISLAAFGGTLSLAQVNATTFGVVTQIINTSGVTIVSAELIGAFTLTVSYAYTPTPATPTALSSAPQGAVDIAGHLSAIWLLGGSDTPGTKTTLSGALSTGAPITSLPVAALTKAYPSGAQVVVWSSASQFQTWTLTAGAAVGATSLAVSSQTPNFAYPSGTTVVCPSAAAHSATSIYFTNSPLAAGGGAAVSDWQDPSSGLSNIIRLDQDSSDPGVALASIRAGLIVFRRNSVWIIKGSSPANFAAVQITDETGCLDPRSVIPTDSGVYFIGQKGLMLTDGTRASNVSGPCTYTLQQAINAQQWNVITGHGGYITGGLTTQGQIIVSIGARGSSGGLIPIWSAMYDPGAAKGGVWVRITSALFQNDGTQTPGNYYPGLIVSDTLSALRSVHSVGSKYFTMLEDQALAYSFLNQSSLYDSVLGGTTAVIPLRWKTRFAPIVGTTTLTRKWGQVKRYFLDHSFAIGGGSLVPGTDPAWAVTPVDSTDTPYPGTNVVLTAVIGTSSSKSSVSAGYGLSPNDSIQREDLDFTNEVTDLGFEVVYSDARTTSTANGVVASIYGLGLEYQPGRDLKSKL